MSKKRLWPGYRSWATPSCTGRTSRLTAPTPERTSYDEVILPARLSAAVARLNPNIPAEVQAEAIRRVHLAEYPSLTAENRRLHRYLVEGVPVEFAAPDGAIKGDVVRLIDFTHRSKMTGWPSTSSPSSSRRPTAGRISCCSSTACPWWSSS